MKLAFLGTLPQWLTFLAVGWLIYLSNNPPKARGAIDVYVENFPEFPRILEGSAIPVEIQASVPLETDLSGPVKIDWPKSISVDLTSVGGEELTVSAFGEMQVPKPQFQTAPPFPQRMNLGLSVDVKSIAR